MVKVDFVCYILGKGVPFVPVAMQQGATEDVLLCALCATRRCDRRRASVAEVRVVRDKLVRPLHPSLQPTENVSSAARWCEYLNPSLYRACNTSYVRSVSKYTCVTRTETVVLYTLVASQVWWCYSCRSIKLSYANPEKHLMQILKAYAANRNI